MTDWPKKWHWSYTHSGAAIDIGATDGANIAIVHGPKEGGSNDFECHARLIAAAPLMLDALEKCDRAIDGSLRGAGQSTAGWMAGRRQMANALTEARAAIAATKEETNA